MIEVDPDGSMDELFCQDDSEKWSFKGEKLRIVHCDGALESYYEALGRVRGGKSKSLTMRMKTQIEKLANTGRLSSDHYRDEGKLPGSPGKPGKVFKALKRIPVRGYCWKSDKFPNTVFISHYVNKDYDKLKDKDVERVHHNWKRIEEQNHDK